MVGIVGKEWTIQDEGFNNSVGTVSAKIPLISLPVTVCTPNIILQLTSAVEPILAF